MSAIVYCESLWQDLRYAARSFRLNKGFFAVAMLSLALGIGANTSIFQLLDAIRLRTLPVEHAEELASLGIAKNDHCCSGDFSDRNPAFTYAHWEAIRDRQQAFSGVFAFGDHRFNMSRSGEPQFAEGLWVSGEFFKTLGVRPLLGRLIDGSDDQTGCGSPNAVISYGFGSGISGGDPGVIGKQLMLESHKFDISGVTPANFYGVEVGRNFDVAVPLCAEPLTGGEDSHLKKRQDWWLAIIGRLKPGWTTAQATAQVKTISASVFESTIPETYRANEVKYYTKYKLEAQPAGSGVSSLRKRYEEPLLLLLVTAGLVLLIACSNLANLMLARASAREREMAIRLAIGANRGRLIRQLLVESFSLTMAGCIAGALLAHYFSQYMVSFLSSTDNPVFIDLGLDWRILGFMAIVAILTCALFGLTPALRATKTHPAAAMKATGRGLTADRQRYGLRRILVVAQVALSLVLLVGALLFVRSLRNLLTLDAGFNQSGLLVAGIDASRLPLSAPARGLLYRDLLTDVQHTRGLSQAATSLIVPISGDGWNDSIEILGQTSHDRMVPWFNRVSAAYFRTMGTPLIAGRDFDQHDTIASPEVAIVNEKFAAKYLHQSNAVGKQFRLLNGPNEPQHVYQIVGMVKNSKYRALNEDAEPLAFVAQTQDKQPGTGTNLVVRSNMPLGATMAALKQTISSRNPGLSFEFVNFETQVQESLLRERLMATLSGFFGFLAAALATLGLYGVISYMVARRRSEIGIRIALGAGRPGIIKLIAKEAVLLLAAGLSVGTILTAATARSAASMLYGLQATDPVTIGLAIAGLALIAMIASLIPAFRASRLEPTIALRED